MNTQEITGKRTRRKKTDSQYIRPETTGIVSTEPAEKAQEGSNDTLGQTCVTTEERQQLIAQAAYFRAERRGFMPGSELEDWLEAEAEIESKLSKNASPDQQAREA